MNEIQGKQEVAENVVTAVLICALTGLVTWGIDTLKARAAEKEKRAKKKKSKR